jgi:anti-sigma factor RsiW
MSCKNIHCKLGAYVDGELPPEEREEVEAHTTNCASCAQMADQMRRLDELAANDTVPPVSGVEWASLWESILARREEALPEARPVRGTILRIPAFLGLWTQGARRVLVPLAAAAALVLAAYLVISGISSKPAVSPEKVAGSPQAEQDVDFADYTKHVSGPTPEIQIDPDGEIINLIYSNF